jgi:hypothetical protein
MDYFEQTLNFTYKAYSHGVDFCLFWDDKFVFLEVRLGYGFEQDEVCRCERDDIQKYLVFGGLKGYIWSGL